MGLDAGEGVPPQGGYRGASLKLAARLWALAKPGEILAPVGVAHLAHSVWMDSAWSLAAEGDGTAGRFVAVVPEAPLPALTGLAEPV